MSTEIVTIGPILLEPLDPDFGVAIIEIIVTGAWSYFTTSWHEECKKIMIENMGGDYYPPDPFSEPIQIDYLALFLFWIAITLGIVSIAYLLKRKFGKGKSLRSNTSSAFCLVNLLLVFQPLKYPLNITVRIYHYLLDYDHSILEFLKYFI